MPGRVAEVVRFNGASGANEAKTVSASHSTNRLRVLFATVKYSAAPTQTGVTVVLNSGIAAAYDTTLNTGSANVQNNIYMPDGELILMPGDALDVTAPAAGGVITSAVAIYCEVLS